TYDLALFDASTIARFAGHYRRLLAAAALRPELRLGELPLLSRGERHALLVEWSAGPRPELARQDTIHRWITARAKRRPEAVAVVFGDDALSYGELERRAERLARRLRTLRVGPEIRVALGIGPSPEMVVGVLGILKAGGAYVPLDPDWPSARLELQLEDVGAAVLVTASPWAGRLPPHPRPVLLDKLPAGRDDAPASPVGAGNAAYVLYTSGSSGRPKGVVVSHRNVLGSTSARLLSYPHGTFLLIPSLAFDSSVAGLFGTLCSGGTLVVVPQSLRADGAALGR
ncbi:MAG: AMP-binding protein, partial [FCB group bacterium]|nr:AMP-binding protein [FCB group bacterium]